MRREFELPSEDIQFLESYGCPWEVIIDGSCWVLLHQFITSEGYNPRLVTAAIRIETGYPNVALDMVYFYPPLSRNDGQPINATNATQAIDGNLFQRWSRHYTSANPFVIGEHNLGTHIQIIEDWLDREFRK